MLSLDVFVGGGGGDWGRGEGGLGRGGGGTGEGGRGTGGEWAKIISHLS